MTADKRIYVGGLFPDAQKSDLTERFAKFGEVKDVAVKVKSSGAGAASNTFAYVTLHTSEEKLQKCFSLYNKTKWKGSELKLELAKESFLHRLMKERQSLETMPDSTPEKQVELSSSEKSVVGREFTVTGAAPGTPVPGKHNWVVGKYGRVLPIVHMKDQRKRQISLKASSLFSLVSLIMACLKGSLLIVD
ncbi:hypothetical protein ScPMuIL_008971 [Solemya velum]